MKWKSNFGRLYMPYRMLFYMVPITSDKYKYELRSVTLGRPNIKVRFDTSGVSISIIQDIKKFYVEQENFILEELMKESKEIFGKKFGNDILNVIIKLIYDE